MFSLTYVLGHCPKMYDRRSKIVLAVYIIPILVCIEVSGLHCSGSLDFMYMFVILCVFSFIVSYDIAIMSGSEDDYSRDPEDDDHEDALECTGDLGFVGEAKKVNVKMHEANISETMIEVMYTTFGSRFAVQCIKLTANRSLF